ncbi:ATP-dependent nuclease subunit B [Lacticaseibacillus rhamnosus]|uniref:ATP-dependent nuclease subunit B n=1 Tax=Lacticaseibacillus rhamnosus TaxID=47715 RepID=A0AAX0K188_LACRH|nr:ATP-dependent nuclease subunit B [Lacticaseibacillus rhamnosus]
MPALTRSPAQKSACKDLGRNGQNRAITPKATYTPTSNRAGSTLIFLTRSPAQKSACKDLSRNGQDRAITPEAAYTPTSNRAESTLTFFNALPSAGACV